MIRGLLRWLDIYKLGLLELLFAFYLILSGYSYGAIKLDMLMLIIMDVLALIKKPKIVFYKPLMFLMLFVLIHEFFLIFVIGDVPIYHMNTLLSYCIFFGSIFIITPALDFVKLKSCLAIVAIISALGILYHFLIIQAGGEVHPIKLPFLPSLSSGSRIYSEGIRPKSFYWEPEAFITFMLVPMMIVLMEKKYILVSIIVVFIFLSTSTTGIILSLLMIGIYVFSQKIKIKYKVLLVLVLFLMIYLLLNSKLFEFGVSKMENTNIKETSRLINGPLLISNMDFTHILFGIPAPNSFDYYHLKKLYTTDIIISSNEIFVSTFWLVLIKFGLIGFLLYINLYIQSMKKERALIPYILIILIGSFAQGGLFTNVFTFQMIFILSLIRYNQQKVISSDIY